MDVQIPQNLISNPLIVLGIVVLGNLITKLLSAVMRGIADRWLKDKDPKNDSAAHALNDAADVVDKVGLKIK